MGEIAEVVGAKEMDHAMEKTSSKKSDVVCYGDSESVGAWVTPRAKRTAHERSRTG